MKRKYFILFIIVGTFLLFVNWATVGNNWITVKQKGYSLSYTSIDKKNKKEYNKLFKCGIKEVKRFFNTPFKNDFTVFVHPSRQSLDSTWQKDWNMPTFKSECWMVASGVANKLDIISPKLWSNLSCEHKYIETVQTQQLITHELVHVFHGQLNASPDFSNTDGIDWFVEGLATFASGQCDSSRIAEVKKAIIEKKIPKELDNFWTGNIKYGLAGSIVMFIDEKYGREKLKDLLPMNKKSQIVIALKTTESELLEEWKKCIQNK